MRVLPLALLGRFARSRRWRAPPRHVSGAVSGLVVNFAAVSMSAPQGYFDASHFTRDSRRFLGMTSREFLALDVPFLRSVLRARALVAGAPTPLLDPPGGKDDGRDDPGA